MALAHQWVPHPAGVRNGSPGEPRVHRTTFCPNPDTSSAPSNLCCAVAIGLAFGCCRAFVLLSSELWMTASTTEAVIA